MSSPNVPSTKLSGNARANGDGPSDGFGERVKLRRGPYLCASLGKGCSSLKEGLSGPPTHRSEHLLGGCEILNTASKTNGLFGRQGTRKRVRWFSVLIGLGVVLVTGTVVADVILTYTYDTSAVQGTSPFQWENGGNYALASSYGLSLNTISTGGGEVATNLGYIDGVNVELLNITNFDLTSS